MNTQNLAKQALNYLASLKSPLPCDQTIEGKKWYEQNEKDYQALLTLNKAGYGATEEELQQLIYGFEKEEVLNWFNKGEFYGVLGVYGEITNHIFNKDLEEFQKVWLSVFDKKTTNTQIKTIINECNAINKEWEKLAQDEELEDVYYYRYGDIEEFQTRKSVFFKTIVKLMKKEQRYFNKASKYLVTATIEQINTFFDNAPTYREEFYC